MKSLVWGDRGKEFAAQERISRPEKKPRVFFPLLVKTLLGMNIIVQHDICRIGSRAPVVIDQHNLESFIL